MKKSGIFTIAVLFVLGLAGCSTYNSLTSALNVVGQVISLAQADLPALESAGTLTPGDATSFGDWLNGASLLLAQTNSCVATVGSKGTKASFVPCITAFGTGLLSPAEMADLRIISPGAQKQVAIYVTAVVLAANAV